MYSPGRLISRTTVGCAQASVEVNSRQPSTPAGEHLNNRAVQERSEWPSLEFMA